MPIPLLIWGGIALGAALLGGGAIYAVNINNIKGKRFTILGTRASGKTSLHKFLSEGELPSDYVASAEEKIKDNYFKLKDLKLRIKSSTDIGGDMRFEQRWKDLISKGDYICYMIKMDKICSSDETDYRSKVVRHIQFILKHMQDVKIESPLYLVFSFCDLVGEFQSDDEKFMESFKKNNLELFPENTAYFFGHLNDKTGAENLCRGLLGKISENK